MTNSNLSRDRSVPLVVQTDDDPDHHLVSNRGFWWVCCSINATSRTKEKLGFSLGTKCVLTARLRRDIFLRGLHDQGLEVRIRRHSPVALGEVRAVPPDRASLPWQTRVDEVLALARAAELPVASSESASRPARRPVAASVLRTATV